MDLKRRQPIGVELVKRGLVTESDIDQALEYQREHPKKKLGDILYILDVTDPYKLIEAIGEIIGTKGVILTNNNLDSILNLINISEKTLKIIKQNLFWSFFYNLLMIPIAMGVFRKLGFTINPMIASMAMVFSSLTVILNTLRLKKILR